MTQTFEAVYEQGVLRPLKPLEGVEEQSEVTLTLQVKSKTARPWEKFLGTLPDEDALEMLNIVEEEFEKVDPREWQ